MSKPIRADQLVVGDVFNDRGALKRVEQARICTICTIASRRAEIEYTSLGTGLSGTVSFQDWSTVLRVEFVPTDHVLMAVSDLAVGDRLTVFRVEGGFYL